MNTVLAALVLICSIIMIGIILKAVVVKGYVNLDEDTQNLSVVAMLALLVVAPLLALSVIVG